jgi:hypothetical protein
VGITEQDILPAALELIEAARGREVPLRLVGGLAVRYLTPDFPPRTREQQDLDLASTSEARKPLTEFLVEHGYTPDKNFNALYGHKQLFFQSPDGRALDVMVDRVEMCHVLEFRHRLDRMPVTLDVADLLLTKLQIVELNEKDAQDVVYLLSAYPVSPGDVPGEVSLDRVGAVLGEDWGWWRTVTMNLDRVGEFAHGRGARLVPTGAPHEAARQLRVLRQAVDDAPKSLRWRMRAKVGDRRKWYMEPEEIKHD